MSHKIYPALRFWGRICPPRRVLGALLGGFLLAACASAPRAVENPLPSLTAARSVATASPARTAVARMVSKAAPTETPAADTPAPALQVCPPFPGASLEALKAAISNPFHPPRPGSDDPHQGVDLAQQKDGIALAGGEVWAILDGTVAASVPDRFPYGNAVLIETPLDELPADFIARLGLPNGTGTPPPPSALTCPDLPKLPYPGGEARALYVLYAHLGEVSPLQEGETVRCGERIGLIGQSGNALNPHLHLETRVGPAGARLSQMAHYTTDAAPEEMRNYCLWRVSGVFDLVDPLRLLEYLP